MKFDELDGLMRGFETSLDQYLLPELWIVARLDGRGFTRLTKEQLALEKPFDLRFRDAMTATVKHLMQAGFRIQYGYTQSDEISLLFHLNEDAFGRKVRKFNSVLAGEASACFSHELGAMGAFDCRICPLPNADRVVDYFRWRAEDAHRNSLNAHCYWLLRSQGENKQQATQKLQGTSIATKNEMLFAAGINYNDLPTWQKRGIGCWNREIEKEGMNPKTGEKVVALRKALHLELELPKDEEYSTLLEGLIGL